ncbi:hypothetical protein [Peribacillus deserti]|uniref:Uncharacterized protein n=1 Tax=Peribacillus deserti TaxID=673318 RepID=A0A2N5M528_9BACI|nr:hypothetical protein [Peribacillus deserti]PLT29468.1 hypothetical protein CUU66_12850 [Peribacillus deserti]
MSVINCVMVYDHVVEKIAIESSRENFERALEGEVKSFILSDQTVALFNEEAISKNLPRNFLGVYGTIIFCKYYKSQISSLEADEQAALLKKLNLQL